MRKLIYDSLLDPSVYPDYTRRPFKVSTWATFDHLPQFTSCRAFSIRDNELVNFREDLDLYEQLNLGRVIWPVFQTIFAKNISEFVEEIQKRNLYLFNIWGHVPGSGTEGMWSHVMPPEGMLEYLNHQLGDRFLGFDNGEQDGRYVAGYALLQCPTFTDRFRQYLNFQRHFERLCDDLGNKMSALVSLCFGHYFLKEGNHILLGAETGQALPNSQIYYAFIRGAGKQYGAHWFGNSSIWNRWGMKSYESSGPNEEEAALVPGFRWGPTEGTSLNLLRRLIYTHYLYNSVMMGFEQSWLIGDNVEKRILGRPVPMELDRSLAVLSPVGQIQVSANELVHKYGQPGIMQTPTALLLDHFSGWVMPRHLYTSNIYQVWGGMPYDTGDYLTHGILSMLYPGYENASYFHDERGFLSPTPYGDSADVLLSDVPGWVLQQYSVLVMAGRVSVDDELRDKLRVFVEQGGHLVATAENARALWPEWQIGLPITKSSDSQIVRHDGVKIKESNIFSICPIVLPETAEVLAEFDGMPLAVRLRQGKGTITLFLAPFGINDKPILEGVIKNDIEQELPCPFVLLKHVQQSLGEVFASQQLFSVGQGLGHIICRKEKGKYTLGVFNPGLSQQPFNITSHCGNILNITEVLIDQRAKTAQGYWPKGMENNDAGLSNETHIAGGDIRIFSVAVEENHIQVVPPITPPQRTKGRFLALRDVQSIKEALLSRPTFFQHFDGIKIDWTYLYNRDLERIKVERGWIERQQLDIIVDFSCGLNFYPDLAIINTLTFRYEQSLAAIEDVFDKMVHIGSKNAVVSLHRRPESHCDEERCHERMVSGVKDLCLLAAKREITLHLQSHPYKWLPRTSEMLKFIDQVGEDNLRYALNTAHALIAKDSLAESIGLASKRLGMVLVNSPLTDQYQQKYDAHLPISEGDLDLSAIHEVETIKVLDADYASWNQEYRDVKLLWRYPS